VAAKPLRPVQARRSAGSAALQRKGAGRRAQNKGAGQIKLAHHLRSAIL
tara:strand:- start:576 stop:722 length:147 start_codon:yes stop_codon:yes gene_type:complete